MTFLFFTLENVIFLSPASSSLISAGGLFGALVVFVTFWFFWGENRRFIRCSSVAGVDQPHQGKFLFWADYMFSK